MSDLKSFYEGWAADREASPAMQDYERLAAAWKWEHLERLIRAAGSPPASILEFGCGSGEMLELAGRAFPQAALHGIDLAERMLAMARSRLPRGRFIAGGIDILEAWAEPVDLVLGADILEHLDEPARAARAMGRAGHVAAFKIPLERRLIRLGLRRQQPGPEHHVAGHLHFWTLRESRALLAGAGLDIVREICVDPPDSIRYHPVTRAPSPGRADGRGPISLLRRMHHAYEEHLERWSCRHHPTLHRLMFGSSHFVLARTAARAPLGAPLGRRGSGPLQAGGSGFLLSPCLVFGMYRFGAGNPRGGLGVFRRRDRPRGEWSRGV